MAAKGRKLPLQLLHPLKLALKHPSRFPHLRHSAPHHLIKNGHWKDPSGQFQWTLISGEFQTTFENAAKPHLIYYDLFSVRTNTQNWTLEHFEKLFQYCDGHPVELFTYSASTAVRSTLLSVGFYVAQGIAMGPKEGTTIAFNDLTFSQHLKPQLLKSEWLERWNRSGAKFPNLLPESLQAPFEHKIRTHPQLRVTL